MKLPTVIVVDPSRSFEGRWWALPHLPVTITFFAPTLEEAIELACVYGLDLVVVRLPTQGVAATEAIPILRRRFPAVRVVVIVGCETVPHPGEIRAIAPDFVAVESLDPLVMAAAIRHLIPSRDSGVARLDEQATRRTA